MPRLGDSLGRYGSLLARYLGRAQIAALDYTTWPVGSVRVVITDSGGTALGSGAILTARGLSITSSLDAIGQASFDVPAVEPLAQYLDNGNHVKVYHQADGYRGEYIIQSVDTDAAGETLRVSCADLFQELVYCNTLLRRQYDNKAVSSVLSTSLIAGSLYGLLKNTGWTPGTYDSGLGNITVTFNAETIFEAIAAIAKRLGKHFRMGSTARTLDFGAFGEDNGYRLIHPELVATDLSANTKIGILSNLTLSERSESGISQILPLGAGTGLAQLTIETATLSSPYTVQTGTNPDGSACYYLQDSTAYTQYGARMLPFVRSEIAPTDNSDAAVAAAADALYTEAAAYLASHNQDQREFSATVLNCPAALTVGNQARVVYRGVVQVRNGAYKWINENALYWVMERRDAFGEDGAHTVELVLSNTGRRSEDAGDVLIGLLHSVQVGQSYVQPYPCKFNDTFEEELDSTHAVTANVDLDNSVLRLTKCLVNFRTRPLRATFTTAANSGAATITSGSSSKTTADSTTPGGTTTNSNSLHVHPLDLDNAVNGDTVRSYGGFPRVSGGDTWYTGQENTAHTHGVPGSAHGHGMDHTHSVSTSDHAHGLTFGVVDDTVYPQTIALEIDGIDRTSALGGPWAATNAAVDVVLDVTTYLVNAVGGLRQKHALVFTCSSGHGKVRVTTKADIHTQAITVI